MGLENEMRRDTPSPESETEESCPACEQFFATDRCSGEFVPLTRDEEAILARMREVKASVTQVKQRIRDLEGRPDAAAQEIIGELGDERERLEALRCEWQELDRQRQEAARFRMQVLGHE